MLRALCKINVIRRHMSHHTNAMQRTKQNRTMTVDGTIFAVRCNTTILTTIDRLID